jgi:hypothetical protein
MHFITISLVKPIRFTSVSSWFYYRNNIMMHGPMNIKFAPHHCCCHAFNCGENPRNMIWWKVFEVCYMNYIGAYNTTYRSVQYFSMERPRIISYIPESFIFVYALLFDINIEHKHEISFIYKHQYVTLLHHVSVH